MPALLLLLPRVFAETAVFNSAFGLGCRQVVELPQVNTSRKATYFNFFKIGILPVVDVCWDLKAPN
jgi:hypothetical protein